MKKRTHNSTTVLCVILYSSYVLKIKINTIINSPTGRGGVTWSCQPIKMRDAPTVPELHSFPRHSTRALCPLLCSLLCFGHISRTEPPLYRGPSRSRELSQKLFSGRPQRYSGGHSGDAKATRFWSRHFSFFPSRHCYFWRRMMNAWARRSMLVAMACVLLGTLSCVAAQEVSRPARWSRRDRRGCALPSLVRTLLHVPPFFCLKVML